MCRSQVVTSSGTGVGIGVASTSGSKARRSEKFRSYRRFFKPFTVEEGPGSPPPAFPGSALEWRVFWWLTIHRIPFIFQQPILGGRLRRGGQVGDFLVTDRAPQLVLNVQGEYYHYRSTELAANAILEKLALLRQGYQVTYVVGRDLIDRLDYTMREALRGHQLFRDTP